MLNQDNTFNIKLAGRLGNQMFIYAFGKALLNEYGFSLVFYVGKKSDFYNGISKFNIPELEVIEGISYRDKNLSIPQKIIYGIYQKILVKMFDGKRTLFQLEKVCAPFFSHFGLLICQDGYISFQRIKNNNINIYTYGYFQCSKYFSNVRDDIKKEFTLKEPYCDVAQKFHEKIEMSKSYSLPVCLHIRLTDYTNLPEFHVCNKDYYNRAIKYFEEKYPKVTFFLFSDDVEKAKEELEINSEVFYESPGMSGPEVISLMSECDGFIISNSSFSWWGQYLGSDENTTVIAPKKWFNSDRTCHIYEENWILM